MGECLQQKPGGSHRHLPFLQCDDVLLVHGSHPTFRTEESHHRCVWTDGGRLRPQIRCRVCVCFVALTSATILFRRTYFSNYTALLQPANLYLFTPRAVTHVYLTQDSNPYITPPLPTHPPTHNYPSCLDLVTECDDSTQALPSPTGTSQDTTRRSLAPS